MPEIIFTDEIYHEGWDIPTNILLDSNGHIWADNAHGSSDGFKGKEDQGHYLKWLDCHLHYDEYQRFSERLRIHFRLKPIIPDWIIAAIIYNWSPPSNFNKDDYEWPKFYKRHYDKLI